MPMLRLTFWSRGSFWKFSLSVRIGSPGYASMCSNMAMSVWFVGVIGCGPASAGRCAVAERIAGILLAEAIPDREHREPDRIRYTDRRRSGVRYITTRMPARKARHR
jgi:hypothetical protein